jgi:GT2 family glycosyltransferase
VTAGAPAPAQPVEVPVAHPSVAVVMITWNRKRDVVGVLEALSRLDYPLDRVDVVVVDNASTDGTLDEIRSAWLPDRVVENPTHAAHEPDFRDPETGEASNKGGFRSLTVVHNHENFGGCGGFNTGFAYVEQILDAPGREGRPDYMWLLDDDIDLPADALRNLVGAAESDERIGLVGSRMCDLKERDRTIESTIYFDPGRGRMADEPFPDHPLLASHQAWAAEVGGPKGHGSYSGLREVDVVSAASMLSRWSAVKEVGFWDHRYFIYCDDADWCLRFSRAGHRVVCNLDAVVYHLPWHHKLTPARVYYSQRNIVWLIQKVQKGWGLKRATGRWLATILFDALQASVRRRRFHAEILRRTAVDIITNHGGKLEDTGPEAEDVGAALERIGALRPGRRVVLMCNHPESVAWARELREHVSSHQEGRKGGEGGPEWVYFVRSDVPGCHDASPGAEHQVYSASLKSRLFRQLDLIRRPARAVVVFDQTNDVPLLRGRYNVHIDRKKPTIAQVERDTLLGRLAFAVRWSWTVVRCGAYALTVRRYESPTKYG